MSDNDNVEAPRITTPATGKGSTFLHFLRIMFGNNCGVIPRRNEFGPYNWENVSGKFNLLRRFFLLISYVWILPAIILFFVFLPYTRYFFAEPAAIQIKEADRNNRLTLPEDVSYTITGIDGELVTQTFKAGTEVFPFFRNSWHTLVEDERGSRFNPDEIAMKLLLDDNKYLEDFPDTSNVIYSDSDIQRFFVGKTLKEVEERYAIPMPVIVLADGSKLAHIECLSGRSGKIRFTGLAVKTDTDGIIREYKFTEETKEKANLLDWIPYVNKIVETDAIRRFIRGYHSSSNKLAMDRIGINLGLSFGSKWYQALLSIVVIFSLMGTALAPAILLPVFVSMLLFMSKKSFSSEKIFQIGGTIGFLILLPLAFYSALIFETAMAAILFLGPFFLCYFVFIPELKKELDVLRCNACAGWDTISFVEELERTEYKDTTIWKYKSGREDKQVSYRYLTKRKYECSECGQEIIVSSWKTVQ